MKYYAFKSLYGYNPSIREGKILAFSSKETLKYILEVNKDLVEIMSIFRIHFREKAMIMNRYIKSILSI